jgi:IstB-like ATP binding protein
VRPFLSRVQNCRSLHRAQVRRLGRYSYATSCLLLWGIWKLFLGDVRSERELMRIVPLRLDYLWYLSAMEMARRPGAAFKENRLRHAMEMLTQPELLIVDEVGYLGLDQAGAAMLFQVICNRYEKNAAPIITSNKAFAEWALIFAGDPVMASAALDRLLHAPTSLTSKAKVTGLKTHS